MANAMRSIERRFANIMSENDGEWSTYTAFAETVRGQNFGEAVVLKWFDKLVDKDDYLRKEKQEILKYLLTLNSIEG